MTKAEFATLSRISRRASSPICANVFDLQTREPVLPQFFFHLRTPDGLDHDQIGLEMPSLEAAYLEAWHTIPAMASEFAGQGISPTAYGFLITDAAGTTLMEVPFAERLRDGRRKVRPGQHERARRLSQEIALVIGVAHETAQRSREILVRARQS